MKIAYLLFAYKNPNIIKKVIDSISSKNCAFFIHIDKKINMKKFEIIRGENVYFITKRIPVYWAEYSGIKAILLLIQQAINDYNKYDYFVLLSGSEYPLCNKNYIEYYFNKNRGKEFINIIKMPNEALGKPISRLTTFRMQSNKPFYRYIINTLSRLCFFQRNYKKQLGVNEPYSGNTWWALTREACTYILKFVENNPIFCKYFENTFAPEEMFFHTILGNSEFIHHINRNIIYEDWTDRSGHPAMINDIHLEYFKKKGKLIFNDGYGSGEILFARKYSDDNIEIVDKTEEFKINRG